MALNSTVQTADLAVSAPPARTGEQRRAGRLLRLLNLYRLTVSSVCVGLSASGLIQILLPSANSALFYEISLLYLLFSAAAIYPMSLTKAGSQWQLSLGVVLDIIAITLMMHAAGGIDSGLSGLLMISIVGAGIISDGRQVGLYAALATLALLAEQVLSQWLGLTEHLNYSQAGMWGIACFAMAMLSRALGVRLQASKALARQRGEELATMSELTDYVIQQMDTGVIVLDADGRVRMMNRAAQQVLQVTPGRERVALKHYSPELARALRHWQQVRPGPRQRQLIQTRDRPLLVQYRRMSKIDHRALLFVDDATSAATEAQQLKLAAWGRLTASMAHEVKNPLGAISHAADLLAESQTLTPADQRLTRIVKKHTRRINELVENVQQLGRRDRARPQAIILCDWLPEFVRQYLDMHPDVTGQLTWQQQGADVTVWFDPGQLNQILTNLCRNGFRHGDADAPRVTLLAGALPGGQAFVDVLDNGVGVSLEDQARLFKPFFTKDKQGTGLGLYLSRELAQANRGDIFYQPDWSAGGRFRVLMTAEITMDQREGRA